ncbi:metalloregulator ArsR/SmtB family transcription factor [Desulfovibrio sp.]|uniref:ArsR/SmtB family transcription factor n=1 Tax=Desulfovibrio sp. TaxID=885 RepID=UPI0023BCF3CC|nr:metalloregulator ArsR/SmtB family transcription factor [Desulfovibrio sp.]MDE7240878.1 metalloregulator ArsR/SmtB family transcription factor [Desulfovibrio sp.]
MLTRQKRALGEQAKIFKALGHPSRLLMVEALRDGEKCVCELRELVGDDMSTVSRHLAVLREAGIVSSEKRGTNIYYTLKLSCLGIFLECTARAVTRKAREQFEEPGAR